MNGARRIRAGWNKALHRPCRWPRSSANILEWAFIGQAVWTRDSKTLYFSGFLKDPAKEVIWKASADGSSVETFAEGCGYALALKACPLPQLTKFRLSRDLL